MSQQRRPVICRWAVFLLGGVAWAQCGPGNPPCILTGQYDIARDGVNSNETILSPSGSFAGFQLRGSFTADAAIYAQPLYVSGLTIGGGVHNVLFVATLNDSVYAIDADTYGPQPGNFTIYWSRTGVGSLINDCGSNGRIIPTPPNLPSVGILSTPVIDASAALMYVVDACLDAQSLRHYYLHALNLADGTDHVPPINIRASVTGYAGAGTISFYPAKHLQRPALLQLKSAATNTIYLAFSRSVSEQNAQYHGWVLAYDGNTLRQQFAFADTYTGSTGNSYLPACNATITTGMAPNWCGHGGGIWMSGKGPAGNTLNGTAFAFFASGNGGFQSSGPIAGVPGNLSESAFKFPLGSTTGLPVDYFAPQTSPIDATTLNQSDWDFGTTGVLLFDAVVNDVIKHLLVTIDKVGYGYVLDQTNLGGYSTPASPGSYFTAVGNLCTSNTQICHEVHGAAYWSNMLFVWPWQENLRVYAFSNGAFRHKSSAGYLSGYPGGSLAISSNGTANGILWAVTTHPGKSSTPPALGTLWAYSATSPFNCLWNSSTGTACGHTDDTWHAAVFATPTVVNGRVYVPTWDGNLLVYANQ
ncbi:MAG TPA: hypothetical protein VKR61_13290 [Bryobacteraceae bacterium]|nr:hypothetical protein [Bryobacteraceae bacterium]